MPYESINPYNLQYLKKYSYITNSELQRKLTIANQNWKQWSEVSAKERLNIITKVSKKLADNIEYHASLISIEMGKPIKESMAEIEKCILVSDYYISNTEKLLMDEDYSDSNHPALVCYEPTGIILAVMPWNFPYWQVFRFLIPNLALGNSALLKHASNVPQCANAIEQLFLESGIPDGVFQNLFIDYKQVQEVIAFSSVSGVTVTGSEKAGATIAEIAGGNIKKSVLELGGSDPFIVLDDADIENAINTGIVARMRNAGQSCIAAKRFFIHKKVFDDFISEYSNKAKNLILGDPLSESTEMGPLAREYLLTEIENQVKESVRKGARIITGGKRSNVGKLFYEPSVITDVCKNMPLYYQETFGPVASVFKFNNYEEAVELANDTDFGLGASIWSKDIEKAKAISKHIKSGIIAINGLVASEPHIPFGGIKKSGYGRELSGIGIKEFANIKTINIF